MWSCACSKRAWCAYKYTPISSFSTTLFIHSSFPRWYLTAVETHTRSTSSLRNVQVTDVAGYDSPRICFRLSRQVYHLSIRCLLLRNPLPPQTCCPHPHPHRVPLYSILSIVICSDPWGRKIQLMISFVGPHGTVSSIQKLNFPFAVNLVLWCREGKKLML